MTMMVYPCRGGWALSRRHCGLMLCLMFCCSALYLLASSSSFILPRLTTHYSPPSSPLSARRSLTLSTPHPHQLAPVNQTSSGSSQNSSTSTPKANVYAPGKVVGNVTDSVPLLTLFTTWLNLDYLRLVRKNTLRNWAQLKPLVVPVLFSNDSELRAEAAQFGWETMLVSRTSIGVPILKHMYLDAMNKFDSTLFSFANGDLMFTEDLLESLSHILNDSTLPIEDHPLLVIGQRTKVANMTDEEGLTFASIVQAAKERGIMSPMNAEDFFVTNRKFPWADVPGVVPGRRAYDNWLVLHALRSRHVVVDITQTAPVIHQTTTQKHEHTNSSYNDILLHRYYKSIQYQEGCIHCSPWLTLRNAQGQVIVAIRKSKTRNCF